MLVPQIQVTQEGIELRIIPSVARNSDVVTLNITPTVRQIKNFRKTPFPYQPSPGSSNISLDIESPEFDTRSLNTSLHVQNGQTVVLGGLVKERDTKSRSGLPWLSRLPGIGLLFGTRSKETDRRHLLIFVTAHLLDPNGAKVGDDIRTLRETARVVLPENIRTEIDKQHQKEAASRAGTDGKAAEGTEATGTGTGNGNHWERGRSR